MTWRYLLPGGGVMRGQGARIVGHGCTKDAGGLMRSVSLAQSRGRAPGGEGSQVHGPR